MGRAIVIGIVIVTILLILAGVLIYHRQKRGKELALERGWALSGDLTAKEEHQILQLNSAASVLFSEILNQSYETPTTEISFLGRTHRAEVEMWLSANAKVLAKHRRKGIN